MSYPIIKSEDNTYDKTGKCKSCHRVTKVNSGSLCKKCNSYTNIIPGGKQYV